MVHHVATRTALASTSPRRSSPRSPRCRGGSCASGGS